jgi:hypothetical protein
MKVNRLALGLLVAGLFGSSGAFAFGGNGDNQTARQCLTQTGSGSSYSYSYKNPGWDGKACTKPVQIWACKSATCTKSAKGSDSRGVVRWNTTFRPGFTPKSTAVDWE